MARALQDRILKKAVEGLTAEVSLLKRLREKKKVSRTKLSRLTQLSTYQVEGLEGRSTQNQIDRILLYIKALGYKVDDVLNLIDLGFHDQEAIYPTGTLAKPQSETCFQEGAKVMTYLHQNGNFFGQ